MVLDQRKLGSGLGVSNKIDKLIKQKKITGFFIFFTQLTELNQTENGRFEPVSVLNFKKNQFGCFFK
jgi:hypothetical protein